MVSPTGQRITYAYVGGRLSTETWFNADGTVADTKTYTYDDDGNMLTATNNAGTYTFTYSGNRLATVTDPNGITLTYEYDDNDNVTSISDSQGGVTTMAYNGNNQVTSKTFQNGTTQLRVDFTYDLAGNVLTATRYNDVAGTELAGMTVYTYSGNRVTSIISTDASGAVLSSYSYSYNAGGELVSQIANGVTTAYAYDATDQLVQAGATTYTYDPNGNTTGPGYTIGSDNRLLSDGTWNLQTLRCRGSSPDRPPHREPPDGYSLLERTAPRWFRGVRAARRSASTRPGSERATAPGTGARR